MSFEKIELPTPRELFIREIEGRIIKGKLSVGEKLPTERELAEQTGISKSVVHFALKDLESLGFIRTVPRHGAYVADYMKTGSIDTLNELLRYNGGKLSFKMSVELVELRNAVEGGALIRLAELHTPEDIEKLRACVKELEDIRDKEPEIKELGAMASHFHFLICELSGNDMFSLMMNSFAPMSAVLWENCAAFWGVEGFIRQDSALIDMIEAGRGYEAQKYISDIFRQFLTAFEEDPGIIPVR